MQLVLCNNRVMAHGEGFLAMGGVVINPETGEKYEGATIAECDSCPSDIGKVGYEYRAGIFTPCAPYGKGDGTIPVLCDDECKAIKDSGIPLSNMCVIERKPYIGTGSSYATLTFDHQPLVVFIRGNSVNGYLNGTSGLFNSGYSYEETETVTVTISNKTVRWQGDPTYMNWICNASNAQYEAIALCIRGL